MKLVHMVAFVLVVVGALNWGAMGLLGTNVLSGLLGAMPGLEKLVYVLVGVSGVVLLATHMQDCKMCKSK